MSQEREPNTQDLGNRGETTAGRGVVPDSGDRGDMTAGQPGARDAGDRGDMTAGQPGARDAGDRGDMPAGQAATTDAASTDRGDGTAGGAGGGASMIQPDAAAGPGLLSSSDESRFRETWRAVQGRFVDDPHDAVRAADALVAEVVQALSQQFSEHKGRLEAQWQRGGEPDTEELRQALQRYRDFFDRLLSA